MATALGRAGGAGQRSATETKQAFKTTEFAAYVSDTQQSPSGPGYEDAGDTRRGR